MILPNAAESWRGALAGVTKTCEKVRQELWGLNKICHVDQDAVAQLTTVAVFNIVIAIIQLQTANCKARKGQLHELQALSEQLELSRCHSGHLVCSDGWDGSPRATLQSCNGTLPVGDVHCSLFICSLWLCGHWWRSLGQSVKTQTTEKGLEVILWEVSFLEDESFCSSWGFLRLTP